MAWLLALAAAWAWPWTAGAQSGNRVTAEQVSQAVLASPNASPALRQYAQAVGSLAMFESGGRLDVYNGTCCSGVLQMNQTNIRASTGLTPEQFRQLPLQAQVNAWSRVMSQALATYPPRALASLSRFDGRAVDGHMILACVQLGIGNCQTMVRSGRCAGFADINGTTICGMADRIAGRTGTTTATPGTGTPSPGNSGTPAPSPGTGTGATRPTVINDCIRVEGVCLPLDEALAQGFETGSGIAMPLLKSTIQGLAAGIVLLIMGSALLGVWRQYKTGVIDPVDLLAAFKTAGMIAFMFLFLMTFA